MDRFLSIIEADHQLIREMVAKKDEEIDRLYVNQEGLVFRIDGRKKAYYRHELGKEDGDGTR